MSKFDKIAREIVATWLDTTNLNEAGWEPRLERRIAAALDAAVAKEKQRCLEAVGDISGITLGDQLRGKITEAEAIALVNATRSVARQVISGTAKSGSPEAIRSRSKGEE